MGEKAKKHLTGGVAATKEKYGHGEGEKGHQGQTGRDRTNNNEKDGWHSKGGWGADSGVPPT